MPRKMNEVVDEADGEPIGAAPLPGTIATRSAPPFAGYSSTRSAHMMPTGDSDVDAHRFFDTMESMSRLANLVNEACSSNEGESDHTGADALSTSLDVDA